MNYPDEYQERYLAHQERKKSVLIEIMKERHSNRMFSATPVSSSDIEILKDSCDLAPSSCARKGCYLELVTDRDDKNFLGGVLVGGVGWVHRAPAIFLIRGAIKAYKAGDEVEYMPFVDAGALAQSLYLSATSLGLHCCYVNPNIRTKHKPLFHSLYGDDLFCGAFAFGYP